MPGIRSVCVRLPDPPAENLNLRIPGAGSIAPVTAFTMDAYDACEDARAFIQSIQPILMSLALPLCILGCLSTVVAIFKTDPPYVDPAKIAELPPNCECLLTFTPIAFCQMLKDLCQALLLLLDCFIGLIGDVVALIAQFAALITNPEQILQAAAACLDENTQKLLDTIAKNFEPIKKLMDAIGFVFEFAGAAAVEFQSLTGAAAEAMLEGLTVARTGVAIAYETLNAICPG